MSFVCFSIRPLAKIKKDMILEEYDEKQFWGITGVKRVTFNKMIEILRKSYAEKHRRRGRKPKLSIENRLLAALEYWNEYRTYSG